MPPAVSAETLTDDVCFCDNCQDPPETPAGTPSYGVEDRSALVRLSLEGKRLIDQGDTTDMETLIKQLSLNECRLELPADSPAVLSAPALYERMCESVVVVAGLYLCDKCTRWHASAASGFAVSESGAIVTNYHVVNAASKKTLVVMTASGHLLPVKCVLAASRVDDLAILQVEGADLVPLPVADGPEAAPVGSSVFVISHPANHLYSLTCGIVSRYFQLATHDGTTEALAITADYARGSSGAPVLNERGQVVGIVKSTDSVYYTRTNGEDKNLQMVFKHCIPASSLRRLIKS